MEVIEEEPRHDDWSHDFDLEHGYDTSRYHSLAAELLPFVVVTRLCTVVCCLLSV